MTCEDGHPLYTGLRMSDELVGAVLRCHEAYHHYPRHALASKL